MNLYGCAKTYPTYNFFWQNHTPVATSAATSSTFVRVDVTSANFADEDAICTIFFLKKLNSIFIKINL